MNSMMNNPRIFLWILLIMAGWLNYEAWVRDYAPATNASTPSAQAGSQGPDLGASVPGAGTGSSTPAAGTPAASAAPATAPVPGAAPSAASTPNAEVPAVSTAGVGGVPVHVVTDVLDLDIDLKGGTIRRADMLKYPKVKGEADRVRLMNTDPATLYLLQTGLTGPDGAARPNHLTENASAQKDYTLAPGATELRVPLTWTNGDGVTVTKTFIFRPGEYRIDLQYDIDNMSGADWSATPYAQIQRRDPEVKRSFITTNAENLSARGPAYRDGKKYSKLKISSDTDRNFSIDVTKGAWIAAIQHHFVSAIVPPDNSPYHFALKTDGVHDWLLSAVGPATSVAAGQKATITEKLFVGPKLQKQLNATGADLDRVADYGILYILSAPLFDVLEWVHNLFGNWGWTIIFVTFLLKLVFYPLSEASGRSMAKMKLLGPRMKQMQETYKDDREKLGRVMMELYKKEKVNPVAGCVPMLVQIPVFLAFYWVLLESVEMRQAPFIGWLTDLSSKDPFYILPGIMAVAMFVQYRLQPQTGMDPVQQKVFMFMPLVMSVMFAFFPSGLVLYWVTNTILSIAQQWNINRRIEKEKAARA
jgi:YidC/Oxa1 family membrane protein insertase